MTEAALAKTVKSALTQGLRANRDLIRDLLAEVIEDVALTHAIQEGEATKPVKRASVLQALGKRK